MHPITRRAFLSTLAGAALATAGQAPGEPEVAIVGAGSAGLNAAARLRELGRSFVILEARDRIGGRAWTDSATFGVPFDRGCAWLHKADDNPYTALAEQWGFTLREHDATLEALYLRDGEASARQREQAGDAEERLDRAIRARARKGRDQAASTVSPRRQPMIDAAETFHGPMSAAVDLDELSTLDLLSIGTDLAPNMLVREGYGTLVARFGEGLPVTLGTPVRRIDYSGGGVILDTPAGALRARTCIVTSSTGVLAAEKIAFDPPLPGWKRDAIADLPMGLLAKIPLQFRQAAFRFGEFDDVLREVRGKRDIYFLCWPFGLNLMIGFVGGDFAWELSAAGEAEAIDFARGALRHMLGSEADRQFVKGSFTHWASDPWALGAYAAAVPGQAQARRALRQPVADRVFFAGEACAPRLTQTCGGAAWSGRETAELVAQVLART
jgi:monoamine oxidase